MPDVRQPDDADRRRAATGDPSPGAWDPAQHVSEEELRRHAIAAGIPGAEHLDAGQLADELRRLRPSSQRDPNAPHRPRT